MFTGGLDDTWERDPPLLISRGEAKYAGYLRLDTYFLAYFFDMGKHINDGEIEEKMDCWGAFYL